MYLPGFHWLFILAFYGMEVRYGSGQMTTKGALRWQPEKHQPKKCQSKTLWAEVS